MTRAECEVKLLEMAAQMYEVYRAYNPAVDFLAVNMSKNGYIGIRDAHFLGDSIILDANGYGFHTIDCCRYDDGNIRVDGRVYPEVAHEEAV